MIRPAELAAIRAGEIDLAFRGWARPRVVVGTRMRTAIGLVEVTAVDEVAVEALTEDDARRAGASSLDALVGALAPRPEDPVWRVGLAYAGPDPRVTLRESVPDATEIAGIEARLDRLDRASSYGAWTRQTLDLIDTHPGVRAPTSRRRRRETADFEKDVRKLKELGLTESLGTPLPRLGAAATRALRAAGVSTLEEVARWFEADLSRLHGLGRVAVDRLREALAERGLGFTAA